MTYSRVFAKKITLIMLALVTMISFSLAKEKLTNVELINIAGKQRMLSQRIAKDYLYRGGDVAANKANQQLIRTLKESQIAQDNLKTSTNEARILNLLAFVEMNNEDIVAKTNEEFNSDNAQYVLDLSETLLEGNEYIMKSLSSATETASSKLINTAAMQGMLAQRIAKYYIAYQLGIKDKNTINQMNKAVEEFTNNHKMLLTNSTNTEEINSKLKKVDRLWQVVYKFYLDIQAGGLPLIVFNTSDDITDSMDDIASLYVKIK